MKPAPALLLLLLAACGSAPPAQDDTVEWMMVAGSPSFDPPSLKTGEYVLYRLFIKEGSHQGQIKLRATKRDDQGVWIETTYIAMNAKAVFKSKIDDKGEVLETWTGVPDSTEAPRRIYLRPAGGASTKPNPSPAPKTDTAVEAITLNGKSYACTRIINTFGRPDGKSSTIKEWCCSQVPFTAIHDKRKIGGLVLREAEQFRMELMSYGTSEGEDLPLPK